MNHSYANMRAWELRVSEHFEMNLGSDFQCMYPIQPRLSSAKVKLDLFPLVDYFPGRRSLVETAVAGPETKLQSNSNASYRPLTRHVGLLHVHYLGLRAQGCSLACSETRIDPLRFSLLLRTFQLAEMVILLFQNGTPNVTFFTNGVPIRIYYAQVVDVSAHIK